MSSTLAQAASRSRSPSVCGLSWLRPGQVLLSLLLTPAPNFAYVLDGGKATVPLRFIRYRIDESGRAVRLDDEKTECKEVKL